MRRPTEIRTLLRGRGRPCSRCDYWHPTIEDRIWCCIEEQPGQDGCWIWRGSLRVTRVGGAIRYTLPKVRYQGRQIRVNRLVWEITYGKIPSQPRQYVDHACGDELCVRPAHLRMSRRVGEEHPRATMSNSQAKKILDAWVAGRSGPEIAREYGVPLHRVYGITHNHSYRVAISGKQSLQLSPPPRPPPH